MNLQVKNVPMLAHWFLLDSLHLANQANREGMHANALALTRQCVESMNIIEIGICGHPEAQSVLERWESDKLTPGKLRAWLQENVWESYGSGLWNEPWSTFMREFTAALQPYAHYSSKLAQWQMRLVPGALPSESENGFNRVLEMRPRAYDPQKTTRITLFHALVTYALGRICIARQSSKSPLDQNVLKLGKALGKSNYLDGHSTDWGQQFWAMLWGSDGNTILE